MVKKLEVKELNIENLPAVMALQDKIFANLQQDEKHFVLKRSVEDFMKALSSENTHMLGVFDGDKLIAQNIFAFPENNQKRDMEEFAAEIPNNEMVIYKAVLVDMDYRGHGLMKTMLDYVENKAKKMGKKYSIIQIAVDNPASWISAMNNGMSVHKVDYDPEDKAKVLYLQKKFGENKPQLKYGENAFTMYLGKNIHKEIPALFNKMQYRIAQGYHAVGIDKNSHCMIWAKPEDYKKQELSQMLTTAYVQGKTTRSL